jgi:hypothetical protein
LSLPHSQIKKQNQDISSSDVRLTRRSQDISSSDVRLTKTSTDQTTNTIETFYAAVLPRVTNQKQVDILKQTKQNKLDLETNYKKCYEQYVKVENKCQNDSSFQEQADKMYFDLMKLQEKVRQTNTSFIRQIQEILNQPIDHQSSQISETCYSSEKESENLDFQQENREIQNNLGLKSVLEQTEINESNLEDCFDPSETLLLYVEYWEKELNNQQVIESIRQNEKKNEKRLITLEKLGISKVNGLQKQIDDDIIWDLVNPARVQKIFDNKNNPGFSVKMRTQIQANDFFEKFLNKESQKEKKALQHIEMLKQTEAWIPVVNILTDLKN